MSFFTKKQKNIVGWKSVLKVILFIGLLPIFIYSQTTTYSVKVFPGAGSSSQQNSDVMLSNKDGSYGFENSDIMCSQSTDGEEIFYDFKFSIDDLNLDKTIDTVMFRLKVSGNVGSKYSFTSANTSTSSVSSLGSKATVESTNSFWGVNSGSENGLNDVDAGETIQFEVVNISTSTGNSYVINLTGFTQAYINETNAGHTHQFISGLGNNLDAFATNSTATISYSNNEQIINLTGAGSGTGEGEREFGVQSVSFQITIFNEDNANYWDLEDYSSYSVAESHVGVNYPARWLPDEMYPCFSWETVPQYRGFKSGRLLDDEFYAALAEYPIVNVGGTFHGSETWDEGMWNVAAALKRGNPTVKTDWYLNSRIIYPWYLHTEEVLSTPEYVGEDSIRTYATYNDESAESRQYWVDIMLAGIDNENVDYTFIDKGTGMVFDSDGTPIDGKAKKVNLLYEQLPDNKAIVGNILRNESAGGGRASMAIADGSHLERYLRTLRGYDQTESEAWAVSIQLMREALSKGKIIQFAHDNEEFTETGKLTNEEFYVQLAGFLMAVEKHGYLKSGTHFFSTIEGMSDERTEYLNQYLGAPLGDPVKIGLTYSRSFENLDVTLDLSKGDYLKDAVATFNWKGLRRPVTLFDYKNGTQVAQIAGTNNFTLTENIQSPVRDCGCHSANVGKLEKAENEIATITFDMSAKPIYNLYQGIFRFKIYTGKTDLNDEITMTLKNTNANDPTATAISQSQMISSNDGWVEYVFDFRGQTMGEIKYDAIDVSFSASNENSSNKVSYYFESLRSQYSEDDDEGSIVKTIETNATSNLTNSFSAGFNSTGKKLIIDILDWNGSKNSNYSILNALGKVLQSGNIKKRISEISVSGIEAGVYFVRVNDITKSVVKP